MNEIMVIGRKSPSRSFSSWVIFCSNHMTELPLRVFPRPSRRIGARLVGPYPLRDFAGRQCRRYRRKNLT
jgi:hypothetical protein